MNERIKELAEQAGVEIELDDYGEIRVASAYGNSLERFAELIVRECMNLVKDCYAEPQSRQSPYQTVCASTIIEDHFGVEE